MQLPPPNSLNSSLNGFGVSRRISSKLSREQNEDKVVTIDQDAGPVFRILIVDRDSMSSDLLASALVHDRRCDAAAIQASELMESLSVCNIDLVIIAAELTSATESGFDLACRVRRTCPNTHTLILLTRITHASVINAFRSGAHGVFSRQQSVAEFLDCVEHVRKGFIWAGRQETKLLLDAFKNIPAPSMVTATDSPALSTRELQVVQYAARGKTNKSIAGTLGLSEHTVKNYLFRAFEKLGVSSRVELLFYLTIRGHTLNSTQADGVDVDTSVVCNAGGDLSDGA
jgi:two-component system, NarL family, nitrate/nitrite response regulator NarL